MANKRFFACILSALMVQSVLPCNVMGMAEPASVPGIKYFNDFSQYFNDVQLNTKAEFD